MLVLGLCVMMKILEYSSGHLLFLNNNNNKNKDINDDRNDSTPSPPLLNNKERVKRTKRKRRKCTNRYFNGGSSALERGGCGIMSGAASLCEGVLKSRLEAVAVPPDLNSNLHLAPVPLLHRPGSGLLEHKLPDSFISNTSSQDFDNSDYQWFLDYGYRETGNNVPGSGTVSLLAPSLRGAMGTSMSQPTSVFSSMSLSLGGPHDFSYDDLAKNLDANLAEIDMENFRTEDIHSILTLPTMCCGDMQTTNGHGEMIASVSGSLIAKIDAFEDTCTSSDSPHTSSTQDQSGSGTEMSICKSELLFSPVKECNPLPAANISVDSLDCELDGDLLLTCQANKDNYTIAFEGSVALCSEGDSDFHDNTTGDSETGTSESNNCWSGRFNMEASTAFVRSDLVYTTWSKVSEMHRPESGNNNTRHLRHHLSGLQDTSAAKSQSLPNLHKRTCVPKPKHPSLMPHNRRMSQFSSSVESDQCVKLFDVQTSSSAHSNASDNGKQSFNLVKLFMKQKSISNDKMSIGGASYEGRQSNDSSDWQSESDSCGAENNQHLAANNKLDNRQHGEFEDSLLHPNLLGPKLINETELASSELECSTRFYPVAEQNNTRNQDINNKQQQQQQQTQRNVDVINNVFTGAKPSNINNNNNNDTQRRCHGTQTKRINGSTTRLTCSIDAVQPNQMRTTDIEITSSPGPRRRSYQAPIATLKNVSTQIPVHVIDQGIQTSSFADVTVKSPFQLLESPNKTSVVKTITPNIKPKPRSQSATTTPEDSSKPVYVYYPNYTLPDLTFLREKQDSFDANVFLLPQKYKLPSHPKRSLNRKLRPFSCNDVETLKKKGLSHIQDWDSLNVLLPQEFKKLLEETQENECPVTTATSSVSSTATQPSSGYRGSSTNISDSSSLHRTPYSPLYVYRYDSAGSESAVFRSTDKSAPPLPKRSISLSDDKVAPPRPPLPRGILRKDRKVERHSTGDIGILTHDVLLSKRLSLHDPTVTRSNKSNDIDEGVDIGMESSSSEHRFEARPPTPPIQQKKDILNNNTAQLWDEKEMLRLRSQVSHFLLKSQQQKEQQTQEQSLEHSGESAIKKSVSFAQKVSVLVKEPARPPTELLIPPPNSPNSQHHCGQRLYQCQVPQAGAGEAVADALSCSPLLEEILSVAPEGSTARSHAKSAASKPQRPVLVDLNQKRELVCAVRAAVEQVLAHYSQPQQAQGDAGAHHLALQALCPTLFALLGDGLRPHVDTVFGPVPNSTWRVVEASAQQGQVSKALNDLVMRLNGDDLLTEGLMKFNAFIFGLLNVHSLDAWLNYLRTRESVLQKHYDPSSFMFLANSATRNLFDQLVTIIEPLSLLPFKLDLLYERKVLEYSLQRLGQDNSAPISPTGLKEWTRKLVRSIQSSITQSYEEPTVISNSMRTALAEETEKFCPTTEIHNISPVVETLIKQRPRSCIDTQQNSFSLTDIASTMKKRWSGIQLGSKLFQAFDKLTTEETDEEYTDSLDKPRRKPRQNTSGSPNNSTSDDNTEITRDDSPPLSTETEDKTPTTVTGEDKFRRLQMKWELLSKDGKPIPAAPKSRIPRLVSSPVRPTAPPIPQTLSVSKIPTKKTTNTPQTTNKTRQLIKPRSLSRESTSQEDAVKPARQLSLPPRRTTAMLQRPTPIRQTTRTTAGVKSTKQTATGKPRQRTSLNTQCLVQTLCHRLPSDSGHLSFNEGEMLTVVLEVDSRWLLCCRGDQKGLVPKDDIIYLDN